MITIDDNDPCGTARQLRQVYTNLVAGGAVAEVEFRAGPSGVQRRVSYARADAGALLGLLREWEAKCALASGRSGGRRRGIATGGVW